MASCRRDNRRDSTVKNKRAISRHTRQSEMAPLRRRKWELRRTTPFWAIRPASVHQRCQILKRGCNSKPIRSPCVLTIYNTLRQNAQERRQCRLFEKLKQLVGLPGRPFLGIDHRATSRVAHTQMAQISSSRLWTDDRTGQCGFFYQTRDGLLPVNGHDVQPADARCGF